MRSSIAYSLAIIAVAAFACGCSTKAGAQTPPTPTRMLTADTDLNQLSSGTIVKPQAAPNGSVATYHKVIDGPFVLTDLAGDGTGDSFLYSVASGSDCALSSSPRLGPLDPNARIVARVLNVDGTESLRGVRFLIKAGDTLCASWDSSVVGPNSLSWSGWKPY